MDSLCEPCELPVFNSVQKPTEKKEGWCYGFCWGEHHSPHSVRLLTTSVNPTENMEKSHPVPIPTKYVDPVQKEDWCYGFCWGEHHSPHSVRLLTTYVNPTENTKRLNSTRLPTKYVDPVQKEDWCYGFCWGEHHSPHSTK